MAAGMSEKVDNRGGRSTASEICVISAMLMAALYLRSTGPAYWLISGGCIKQGTGTAAAVEWLYEPITWLCHHSPAFRGLFKMWTQLWTA